jgi:hypothetical protein
MTGHSCQMSPLLSWLIGTGLVLKARRVAMGQLVCPQLSVSGFDHSNPFVALHRLCVD